MVDEIYGNISLTAIRRTDECGLCAVWQLRHLDNRAICILGSANGLAGQTVLGPILKSDRRRSGNLVPVLVDMHVGGERPSI